MWSSPVERRGADGSKYSLVLLDTEGIDAYDQVGGGCCRCSWSRSCVTLEWRTLVVLRLSPRFLAPAAAGFQAAHRAHLRVAGVWPCAGMSRSCHAQAVLHVSVAQLVH